MPDTDNTNYGNTVNGVLYELIDSLTIDTQTRIKGRQLIDKALAQEANKAVDRLLHEVIEQAETYDTHEFRGGTANSTEKAVPIAVLNTYLRGGNHDG